MPDPTPTPEPTFWQALWSKIKAILVKLAVPGVAVVVVVVAILLIAMGWKELQIGGFLARLFGKKDPALKAIDVANSVPEHRVDKAGNLIPVGTPDSKGQTQAAVVPIKEPGLFSNPDTVEFTPPGKFAPVEVQLPDGVKNRDVEKVIVVQPDKFVVSVKDDSGVPASKVDDLLAKYGG